MRSHALNYVFHTFLCVFLAVCVSQGNDCRDSRDCSGVLSASQCCNVSGFKICSQAGLCSDACRNDSDCPRMDDKCNDTRKYCTRACNVSTPCPSDYTCSSGNNECVPTNEPDQPASSPVVYILPIIGGTLFVCCCILHRRKRQGQPSANPPAAQNQNQLQEQNVRSSEIVEDGPANTDQSVGAHVNTSIEPDPPDVIQDSGPPPYHTLSPVDNSDEPELPPPTYDEAVAETPSRMT